MKLTFDETPRRDSPGITTGEVRSRLGFTLVELLVTIFIIGLIAALLLPATQSAREAARRAQCRSHLRQIGLAVSLFDESQGHLPSATYGPPYNDVGSRGSAFTKLLPYMEQTPLALLYDWSRDWYDEENQEAINTPVPLFRCPSATSGNDIQIGLGSSPSLEDAPQRTAAVTDYTAVYSWGAPFAVPNNPFLYDPWAVGALSPIPEDATGVLTGSAQFRIPRRAYVTDGTTYTLTFVERAASTQRWVSGLKTQDSPTTAKTWAPWAGRGCIWVLSYLEDGVNWAPTGLGPCNINCNNQQGIYAFHPDGANAVFLDGAVHFLAKGIDPRVLYAMVSRSRGEIVDYFN